MQGVEFEAKLRLLPLVAYDMVLGMDWLNTPLGNTKVNWKEKYIHVFREGELVEIKGVASSVAGEQHGLIQFLLSIAFKII